jgi:hypothetical protein
MVLVLKGDSGQRHSASTLFLSNLKPRREIPNITTCVGTDASDVACSAGKTRQRESSIRDQQMYRSHSESD